MFRVVKDTDPELIAMMQLFSTMNRKVGWRLRRGLSYMHQRFLASLWDKLVVMCSGNGSGAYYNLLYTSYVAPVIVSA